MQFCRFPLYDLTYAHYCKFPSWGLQATSLYVGAPHPFPSFSSVPRTHKSSCSTSSPHPFPLTNLFSSIFNMFGITTNSFGGISSSHSAKPKQNQTHQNNHQQNFPHQIIPLLTALTCVQLLPFVLVYCIEECSPLVLFSWWRNKISWDATRSLAQRMQLHWRLCWQPPPAKVVTVVIVVPSIEPVLKYTTNNHLSKASPNCYFEFRFLCAQTLELRKRRPASWYAMLPFI